MNLRARSTQPVADVRAHERGSVFILVLWISFGLIVLAVYFAHSMSFELRAADNRSASVEAEQAIVGALRYATRVVTNVSTPGMMPDPTTYQADGVPLGDASFWLIGRSDQPVTPEMPTFGLVDEASKLNLNTATFDMLQSLPRMTPEIAGAILDWKDANSEVNTNGGAEDEIYGRLNPARRTKNANFESVEELRLVYGVEMDILFGEDANLNGALDPNENDGDVSSPTDNHDSRLDPGLLEYVTVYSREPNKRSDGSARINVSNLSNTQVRGQLASLFQEKFGTKRGNEILATIPNPPQQLNSILQFYLLGKNNKNGMTSDEFAQIATEISVSNNAYLQGLVNVNTASETVLVCLPGIGTSNAPALIAYRQSNPDKLTSIAWVAEAIEAAAAITAGRYLTANTYQFSADIAAVGHHGRGYSRVKFILDTADGAAKVLYRRDLTHLGWALGSETRNIILLSNNSR